MYVITIDKRYKKAQQSLTYPRDAV